MDHSEVKHLPKVDHTPAKLDEASKLLLKAADMIERDGWWGCGGPKANSGHCAMLAIHRAADPERVGYHPVAKEAVERLGFASNCDGMHWNDAPGRTKDEVVAKLRAVALGL